MKQTRKTNMHLVALITDLKRLAHEKDAPIWRDIASRLEKPSRVWAEVNVSAISRNANDKETVIVPGKLLGSGDIDKAVFVAAYKASGSAVKKIKAAGGNVVTIKELSDKKPDGSGIRIMG